MKERMKSRYIRCIGVMLCIGLLCFNSGEQMSYIRSLPDKLTLQQLAELKDCADGPIGLRDGESRQVAGDMSETLSEDTVNVTLMGIPIRQMVVSANCELRLMPGGVPIGVSIYTDGVLVVGLGSVKEMENICPAADGGIKAGDVIVSVNGEELEDSLHLSRLCSAGGELNMTIRRNNQISYHTVTPIYDDEAEAYLAGMWVRDSTSGIGTLSYWDMQSGRYGALGHPITDSDTGSIIDVKDGSVIKSNIIGVSAGSNGSPGEVIGSFSSNGEKWGDIDINCEFGIYGDASGMPNNPIYPDGLPIGRAEEVEIGAAEILCTVTDGGISAYECEIVKLFPKEESGSKGIVLKVTSSELIQITGGIVQGMSGSPIIQDGKLVGAVTHVLVNDPTRGYGIFIENMLEAAD